MASSGFLLRGLLGKESAHPKEYTLSDLQEGGAQPEAQGPADTGQQGDPAELDRSRDGDLHRVLKGDIESRLVRILHGHHKLGGRRCLLARDLATRYDDSGPKRSIQSWDWLL